jgi:hypothetical protein
MNFYHVHDVTIRSGEGHVLEKGNYWSWRHDVGVAVNSRVGDASVEEGAAIYVTYYQLGMMVLLKHCCWTSVVWTAEGQEGKGSGVLELVQARLSAINTSSGEDKLVACWTVV